MNAALLIGFFEGRASASELDDDLADAFRQSTSDSYQLQMSEPPAPFTIRIEHLVQVCDAVESGHLGPDCLRAIGFGILASDGFNWDGESPEGDRLAETLNDWASPEVNFVLSRATARKFRERLLTGKDTFTRADHWQAQ